MEERTRNGGLEQQGKLVRFPLLRLAPLVFLAVISSGCHSLKLGTPTADKPERVEKEPTLALPGKNPLRVSQFLFLADFKLREDQPIFRELSDMRDQVYKDLQLPSSNTVVQVYLFEDKERYKRFMHAKYPDLPERRAFFVAQPHGMGTEDLMVYTYWGEQVQQDLRHELTHALLHSVLKDVPLWLDEGLAEYYELLPARKGLNTAHVSKLRGGQDGPTLLSLPRLEKLSKVGDMRPAEYQESWAWVHLMLHSTPEAKAVLLQYLQRLRTTEDPGPLRSSLAAVLNSPEEALESHLTLLEKGMVRAGAKVQR